MFAQKIWRQASFPTKRYLWRSFATLEQNPHIFIFPHDGSVDSNVLSLLSDDSTPISLAIGTTTQIPPTIHSFRQNPKFLTILNSVLAMHAHEDKNIISQAQALASTSGSSLGSGGAFFPSQNSRRRRTTTGHGEGSKAGGDGAGGASSQGGAGGGGRGGWIHVYDERHPPDYGRIPEPEDIFGSLEVDGQGNFVDGSGRYQESGTYRMITNDGILGLTPFLRGKVIERLRLEKAAMESA